MKLALVLGWATITMAAAITNGVDLANIDATINTNEVHGNNLNSSTVAAAVASNIELRVATELPLLKIELGHNRQHIGSLRSQAIRFVVSTALNDLCPENDSTCDTKRVIKVPNIEYNDRGRQNTKAHLEISVIEAIFPDGYEGIRDALIFTIAAIYGRESEDPKNCYDIHLKKDNMDRTWCNVGHYVRLSFSYAQHARLHVHLNFNGKTKEGAFDCVAIKEATFNVIKDLDAMIAPAVNLGSPDILPDPRINCNSDKVDGGDVDLEDESEEFLA